VAAPVVHSLCGLLHTAVACVVLNVHATLLQHSVCSVYHCTLDSVKTAKTSKRAPTSGAIRNT